MPGPVGIGWGVGHDGEMVLKGTNSHPNVRCIGIQDLTYIRVTITDYMLYSKIVKRVDLKRCNRKNSATQG